MVNHSGHIYALETSTVDSTSMNSTILIEDSEREIDPDSSYDLDGSALERGSSAKRFSSNDVDNGLNEDGTRTDGDATVASSSLSEDVGCEPLFKVMFRDESVARQYRQQVKEFLHTLVQSKPSFEEDVTTSSLILKVWGNKDNLKNQDSSVIVVDNSTLNNDSITESYDNICDSLFTIDTQPKLEDHLEIPTYGKKYENAFEKSKPEQQNLGPKLNCFNCMGNHNLRDCQLPRNQANINRNRKEFAARNVKLGIRYHLNEEQKFGHMIPGQLSSNLREALGLKDNELPKHIYRMRLLGYPPGWLEEARLQHSGLSLFNSDGIAEEDSNDEPGVNTTDINRDKYDLKRIYDFPGFNVPPPPGTVDESRKFSAPQMQIMHSKETMLSFLQGKKADDGYKRKKLKLSTSSTAISVEACEMDIDGEGSAEENVSMNGHFVPPLPKELVPPPLPPPSSLPSPPPPPPPPPLPLLAPPLPSSSLPSSSPPPPASPSPSQSSSSSPLQPLSSTTEEVVEHSNSQSKELPFSDPMVEITPPSFRADSPSLLELERMKKRLLVELEETNSQVDTPVKKNLNTTSDMQLSSTSTPRNLSRGSIKSVDLGTPILESCSPFNKLPSSEKFSQDICDVINFENLPDATGKYEQMTEVLQKVRNTMSKIHQL